MNFMIRFFSRQCVFICLLICFLLNNSLNSFGREFQNEINEIKNNCQIQPSLPSIEIKNKDENKLVSVYLDIRDKRSYLIVLSLDEPKCKELVKREFQEKIEYYETEEKLKESKRCFGGTLSGTYRSRIAETLPKEIKKELWEADQFNQCFKEIKIDKFHNVYFCEKRIIDGKALDSLKPAIKWTVKNFEYEIQADATKEHLIELVSSALQK